MQQDIINHVADVVTRSAQEILGDNLHSIILYGSCARGDFNEDSDIDIMILADVLDDDRYILNSKIGESVCEIEIEYGIFISISLYNKNHFNEYFPISPYYQNVMKDGVMLFAS